MEHGLNGAFGKVGSALLVPKDQRNFPDWALSPTNMTRLLDADFPCFADELSLDLWLGVQRIGARHGKLLFDRSELHRWFKAKGTGFRPNFEFLSEQKAAKPGAVAIPINDSTAAVGPWPWGSHHTELLGHLEAAAKMFWVRYDPANPKATAPKNETVINWLKTERNVSQTVAISMATMLRPDGLKTGPRVNCPTPAKLIDTRL